MDMLERLGKALIADEYIAEQTQFINEHNRMDHRVKPYEYPETGDVNGPVIIIDPLAPPLDSEFGDDQPILEEYLYQIDVWSKDRNLTKELARRVKKVMREHGFYCFAGGVDEYDRESGIFRDARRFRGKAYTEEFKDAQ